MQDTPASKITYEAHVTVKDDFVVKMSANDTGVTQVGNGIKQYNFYN